jgi:hypothetical protein
MKSFTLARSATLALCIVCLLTFTATVANAQLTFGGNAQHTGIFTAPAQPLNTIKWQTDIDFNNTGGTAHYGSPVVSAGNTVFVPVRTVSDGFRVDAFNGATGSLKYTLSSDYIMPTHGWIPPYNICIVGTRLYFAGAGGTMFHVDNIDSNTPTAPVREVFYGSTEYNSNVAAFNNTIFANTPITADSAGNIFFGFRVQGTAPLPLNTTQSGLARISSTGIGSFVLASAASGDDLVDRDSHAAGPALSNDETSVYFPVKASSDSLRSYLVELNSANLMTRHSVRLLDPRNGAGARILEDATSTPMVAPDGDVYFGVFGSTSNGSRGFLLRFSGDLQTTKTPGAFGWDYTPGIVPASMVPSYTGTSSYLIFCKYNDYAIQDGSGVNRVAVLDPNATQIDPHTSAPGLVEMREVVTVIGFTPDNSGGVAVKEFCINAPAVNPATNSVFFDSEDGHIYRWNLATNSVDQAVTLSPGLGQPYVPTVIGPDGTLYTLNGGNFFAVGAKNGVSITLTSSSPDLSKTVVGDSITFTSTVSGGTQSPTGTVSFVDLSYNGTTPVMTTIATNVPLDANGRALVTTSSLVAAGANLGNHFITATYNGDGTHLSTSVTMIQKIHQLASTVGFVANGQFHNVGEAVQFNVTARSVPQGAGFPSGMVTLYDGPIAIDQKTVDSAGNATFIKSFSAGVHNVRVVYAGDSGFAMSENEGLQFIGPTVAFQTNPMSVSEGAGHIDVPIVVVNSFSAPITVEYSTLDSAGTNPCSVINGNASSRCDYLPIQGKLTFTPGGPTTKTISIPLVDDAFAEGDETFTIRLSNITGASLVPPGELVVTIHDNETVNGLSTLEQTEFFVRQHYLDFLNREPDTAGFDFWVNEINSCGLNNQCREVKRINVSAAFFQAIEFQETGYLVERMYKVAFGDAQGTSSLGGQQHALLVPVVRFNQFLGDSQQLSSGLIVGQTGWQQVLENNKQIFAQNFVQRPQFTAPNAFPLSLTPTQFVDKLNTNAGSVLSDSERSQLIDDLTAGTRTRDQVVRAVAEDTDLINNERNRAFVLMQYFGYLRRDPNDAPDIDYTGYDFWLTKLNQFNGNFVQAEMVKAFITSDEYRHRFGP